MVFGSSVVSNGGIPGTGISITRDAATETSAPSPPASGSPLSPGMTKRVFFEELNQGYFMCISSSSPLLCLCNQTQLT